MSIDWIFLFGKEVNDERLGINLDSIVSANDGDVCISLISYLILQSIESPNCIDIGAEQGWWSIFCAKKNPKAKIQSFEPNPYNFESLSRNTSNYENISIFPIAISDKKGEIPMTFYGAESHSRSSSETKVICDRLDSFLAEHEVVDLMKIDTEGHEIHILQSLESRFPLISTIIFEWSVYWYGNTYQECMAKSFDILKRLLKHYNYLYIVSRRGIPTLHGPLTEENLVSFLQHHYMHKAQTDIVASKNPISFPTSLLTQIDRFSHPQGA